MAKTATEATSKAAKRSTSATVYTGATRRGRDVIVEQSAKHPRGKTISRAKMDKKLRTSKAERKRTLATHLERNGAHAYAERVPIMRDELADTGGAATVKELFKALKTSPTGLFATERRVAATYRYDQRQESPIFERSNGAIMLRKRQRTSAGSKRQRSNGTVSRKRTRTAS